MPPLPLSLSQLSAPSPPPKLHAQPSTFSFLTCELQETISQRTLAMVYMSHYTEVPDLVHRDVFSRVLGNT